MGVEIRCPATGRQCVGQCPNTEDCVINEAVESSRPSLIQKIQRVVIQVVNRPQFANLDIGSRLKLADKIADLIKKNL